MAISTDNHTAASANGDLVNRVQQLRLGEQLGAAKRGGGGSWLPWVLCGMLALTWAGLGVRWYRAPSTKSDDNAATAAPVNRSASNTGGGSGDTVTPVATGEILLQLKGNLVPFLQITISPIDVSGEVKELNFKEGDEVTPNTTLAVLRDTRYRNEFDVARANYEATVQRYQDNLPEAVRTAEKLEMVAQIREAEAVRLNAEKQLDLIRASLAKGSGSQQDLYKAEADLNAATERVNRLNKSNDLLLLGSRPQKILAAKADMEAAKARMDEAERMLNNCKIRAPISGTILTKSADKGTLVSPMSFNVASGICTMANLKQLEVEIDIPERQIMKIRPGLDCQIVADANPAKPYRGYVDRIMPIADDSKNVVRARVRVILPVGEKAGSLLRPKMSVVVTMYNREFAAKPEDQPWE